jgi:glycosyltransferase involved in cell wall biosynthesis
MAKKDLVDFVVIDLDSQLHIFGEWAAWADVIIFQFAHPADLVIDTINLINEEKLPKLVVVEFDDNYNAIHPTNEAYRYFGTSEIRVNNGKWLWRNKKKLSKKEDKVPFDIVRNHRRLTSMNKACQMADIVTTTTRRLADTFNLNNVHPLPNFISPDFMPLNNKPARDYVVIGWQGGDSHYNDLITVFPVLKRIKEAYGDRVKFRFMGADFRRMYSEVKGEFTEWIEPGDFFDKFSNDVFDIGIIPLLDTDFNRAKSNIKWLEYSYYNIPSVVSKVPPYSDDGDHGNNILFYTTEDEMFSHIKKLIDDPIFRFKLAHEARKHVLKNYDIRTYCHKWYDLYLDKLNEKIKRLAGIE